MATARDVMTPSFHTIRPELSIAEAAGLFKAAAEEEGRRVFGMLVVDEEGRLVGMLSMYDIMLLVRPKHIHVWGMMDDIDVSGLIENVCERAKALRVEDIMTTEVVTVPPDAHAMMILDIMIKKHIRRIPVVNDDEIEGIVYISDLFYHIVEQMAL